MSSAPAFSTQGKGSVFTITLPLIAPGILSGLLFAFVTSFDEVIVALFINSPAMKTLPVQIYASMTRDSDPTVAAVSTLAVAVRTRYPIAVAATVSALALVQALFAGGVSSTLWALVVFLISAYTVAAECDTRCAQHWSRLGRARLEIEDAAGARQAIDRALDGVTGMTALHICFGYALVHGKTYRQMVMEKMNHEAKRIDAMAQLIGPFGAPELMGDRKQ